VAKRRFRTDLEKGRREASAEARAVDRRQERKRARAAREAGNVRAGGGRPPLRRVLIISLPVAVVAVVVVLLLVNPSLQGPCLQLTAIPSSSGVPAFPAHNASLATSWCPSGVTPVLQAFPLLTIRIGATTIGFPTNIGRDTNYTEAGQPYTCQLPIATEPSSTTGLPPGSILLVSPWPYIYTLGDFFQVWYERSTTVNVNSSFPSQPVTYTATDLLGFTADATHAVRLYVDGQLSSAGPSLNLDTLANSPNVYPACLGRIYGTGHSILLTYSSSGTAAISAGLVAPHLATEAAGPGTASGSGGAAAGPALTAGAGSATAAWLATKGLGWLALRSDG
jgi:hypothetical protein